MDSWLPLPQRVATTVPETENDLRRRIAVALKANQGARERVRDCHGSNEYGLDLIMLREDAFGQLRAYGMQMKVGDIACTGAPTARTKETVGQLAIACGQEVEFDRVRYPLSGLYLVTSGIISELARRYISSACHAIGSLSYIDGDALDEFFALRGREQDKFGRE